MKYADPLVTGLLTVTSSVFLFMFLSYSMMQDILEKLIVTQTVKKFTNIYGT